MERGGRARFPSVGHGPGSAVAHPMHAPTTRQSQWEGAGAGGCRGRTAERDGGPTAPGQWVRREAKANAGPEAAWVVGEGRAEEWQQGEEVGVKQVA